MAMCRPPQATNGCLIVIGGATGVGKSALALRLGKELHAPIVAADSRQLYYQMPIGTAAPTLQERAQVSHYMVGVSPVEEHWHAARYESVVIPLLERLLAKHQYVFLVGGSMLYLHAITHGIDNIPSVTPEVRQWLAERWGSEGTERLLAELRQVDPIYYAKVDRRNTKRIIHALEVFHSSGKPFSSFLTGAPKSRPFSILRLWVDRPREELYERINARTLKMLDEGWIAEAEELYPKRHLNALDTPGYKELFAHFEGRLSLDEAIALIQRNTRIYARKQLTWRKKQPLYHSISPAIGCTELRTLLSRQDPD